MPCLPIKNKKGKIKKMKCIIVKMYINGRKDYYLVTFEDFEEYKKRLRFSSLYIKKQIQKKYTLYIKRK